MLPFYDPPFTPLENQQPPNVLSAKYKVLSTGDTKLNKPDKALVLGKHTAVQRYRCDIWERYENIDNCNIVCAIMWKIQSTLGKQQETTHG